MRPSLLSINLQRSLAPTACALLILLSAAEASAGLVQTSGKKTGTLWSGVSRTENAASNFTVGNTVIVSMAFYGSADDLASVEIAGTTATRAVRSVAVRDGSTVDTMIYYAKIVNSGRSDVVMNNGGVQANYTSLSIDEWSEIQDNPVDTTGIAGPTTSNSPTASSGALSQTGEVVYFALGYYNSDQPSITSPAGYTNVFEELTGTANAGGAGYYKIVSATASENPTATLTNPDLWTAAIATFKLKLGAPTIGAASPGFGSATVAFTAPLSDGGSPITSYTATCGSQSSSAPTSPITVGGLLNGVPVTCTVFATNGNGDGPPSSPSNTVTPNGPIVSISVVPVPANEGCILLTCSGTTSFAFTLMRTGPAAAFNVFYTIGGDVVAPEDYTALSGTVAFTAAQTTRTVTVAIKRDSKYEIPEALTLTLTGADAGASVGALTFATTTVLNDDNPPTISIANRTVAEGTLANFAVTLSNGSYQAVSVTATTANGTARDAADSAFIGDPKDYDFSTGTLIFAANTATLSQNFAVPTINDLVYEGGTIGTPETYSVTLSGESGASIADGTGDGLITDNEAKPAVSITSVSSQTETSTPLFATTPYVFTVTLNRVSVEPITVTPVTADGTASASAGVFPVADYVALPGSTVSFGPGETSKTVNVTVIDDAIDEPNETFSVQLTSLVNVNAGTVSRTATINDDDAQPLLTLTAPSPTDEESGPAEFTLSLSAISGRPISVNAATAPSPGTATSGVDYTATGPQAFNWAAGTNASQSFNVALLPDLLNEASETFRVNLTGNVNAGFTVNGNLANATIADNDPIPSLSIDDVSILEGNSGTSLATFTVSLSAASGRTVTVRAGTANQTATAGATNDYVARSNILLTFAPLQTTQPFSVTVNGDSTAEQNETFLVNLSTPVNVTVPDPQGVGSILNDEPGALSINNMTLIEGDGPGTTMMNFTVSTPVGAPPSGLGFTYVTGNLTASDTSDYVAQGPMVVAAGTGGIDPGMTMTTISIPINGDEVGEAFETLSVTLSSPTGTLATILDGVGIGTIENDDPVPPGALVISEFRLKGPAGSADEFIEIANTTADEVTVFTTNDSAGFSVADATGTPVFIIPNGTTIPAQGHFLAANAAGPLFAAPYSLKDFGGVDAAIPDATWAVDLPDDRGLALFDTANSANYGSATVYDAVGFTTAVPPYTDVAPYVEGTGLNGIGAAATPNNHSFVRKHLYGGGSGLQDMGNNALDFVLVATDASTYGVSPTTTAVLGGPSPENLTAETARTSAELQLGLCNPAAGQYAGDNYLFTPATGTVNKFIELRRTFTNLTATAFGALRFKATSLSVLNRNGGGAEADYRVATSSTFSGVCTAHALTLEEPPGYLTTGLPGQLSGSGPMGGLNSTLRTTAVPLAPVPAGVVGVNFKLYYTTSGVPGYFWVTPQAKP